MRCSLAVLSFLCVGYPVKATKPKVGDSQKTPVSPSGWAVLSPLLLGLGWVCVGCSRAGTKLLGLANVPLVNLWMLLSCLQEDLVGSLDGSCLVLEARSWWRWEICLFMQEKKDETGHASLTRVAVSSFKRVGLCCEQTFHKESVLSLGNTANTTLCHPHWDLA